MKKIICSLILFASCMAAVAQPVFKADKKLLKTIETNFTDAAAQYKVLMKNLPANKFPKTYFQLPENMNGVIQAGGAVGFTRAHCCTCTSKQKIQFYIMKPCVCWSC